MNISSIHYGILKLKRGNYKFWKEKHLLHLGWMDIDYAIRKLESLLLLRPTLSMLLMSIEEWEKLNSLCDINRGELFYWNWGFVNQQDHVRELLKVINEQFITLDKSHTNTKGWNLRGRLN